MNKYLLLFFYAVAISGCASMSPASKDVQKTFTYDYEVESLDKEELWVRARNFFAEEYGDSRSVLRVQDREESTLIGRAIESWYLSSLGMKTECLSEYNVRFQSKEGRARLKLELMEGVPALSDCTGWPWPTKNGYDSIVASFEQISQRLEEALKKSSSFSDF